MSHIAAPEPVSLNGNVEENWNLFKCRWRNYCIATGLEKKDERQKIATLLSVIGKDAYSIYVHLNISEEERTSEDSILQALTNHFQPTLNVIYERSLFYSATQKEGESIELYIGRLRKLISTCKYGNMADEMLRDRLVLGINDLATKKQLISDPNLTLQIAINLCKSNEAANKQVEELASRNSEKDMSVDCCKYNKNKMSSSKLNTRPREVDCKYCGNIHEWSKSKCPAFNQASKKQEKLPRCNSEKNISKLTLANKRIEMTSSKVTLDNRIVMTSSKLNTQPEVRQVDCKYCGYIHEWDKLKCPAFNQECYNCGKQNHFSRMCTKSKEDCILQ